MLDRLEWQRRGRVDLCVGRRGLVRRRLQQAVARDRGRARGWRARRRARGVALGPHRHRLVEHARRRARRMSAMARRATGWRSASRDSRRDSSSSKRWHTSARAGARRCACRPSYDLLLTQRLVLQPELELERLRQRRSGAADRRGIVGSRAGFAPALRIPPRIRALSGRELVEALWRHRGSGAGGRRRFRRSGMGGGNTRLVLGRSC